MIRLYPKLVIKGNPSEVQLAADPIHDWSKANKFQLNCDKTKELAITFTHLHQEANLPPIHAEGNPIRTVTSAKLLGVTINSKLSWNDHLANLVEKASRKLYFLVLLKRAIVSTADMVAYYCTCIRSSLDYACQVFHYALPKYLRADLERIQKRANAVFFFTCHTLLHWSKQISIPSLSDIVTSPRNSSKKF